MRYSTSVVVFVLVLFGVLFGAHLPWADGANIDALPMTRGEGPVDIEADELSYEKDGQRYEAHGHVEVTRGDLLLKADHARLSMATKDMMAWGNVTLREGEDVLECERLEVNLDTRLGKVYQARLFLKDQNVHITGGEAEKLGESRYRIREGTFTTCDAKRPAWKFAVKELEVTLGGSGVAKGSVFYLEGIPVLYLPVGVFSLKNERETGFLLPNIGYSNKFGPDVRTAFYWAIAKNMDATFYLNRLGDNRGRGFEEGLEYRYAFTKDTRGQANFYFIDDQIYEGNRYAFFYKHHQTLPQDFYLKGDFNYVSDNDYPRDFDQNLPSGTDIDSRSLKQIRSVLFGGKNWEHFSFVAEGMAFRDLTQASNDETVQKLPQLSFFAHPQTFFRTPLFFDFSSTYVDFWRVKGVKSHRVDLLPRVSYPVRLFNVLKLESEAGLRETLYRAYDDPTGRLNKWKSREIPEGAVQVSTEFYRVHAASASSWISHLFRVDKWMHTVEPLIGYRYNTRVDQEDFPLFDDSDRIPYTNEITYGFSQRLVGKPIREGVESGPQEFAKLKIFQSYSVGDPFERDGNGKGRYFSDVVGELWWRFGPYVSAHGDIGMSPYDGNIKRLNGLITLRDWRNDALQIEYRNTKDSVKGINLSTRLKTITPLYVHGGIRYNLKDRAWIDKLYGLEYQAQCWTLGVVVEDKGASTTSFNTSEFTVQIYFNLLGIGSVGNRAGAMTL